MSEPFDTPLPYDEAGPLYVERTPWRTRLILWPGRPFKTLPLPYLFERYSVYSDHIVRATGETQGRSEFGGFFRHSSAMKWILASEMDPEIEPRRDA